MFYKGVRAKHNKGPEPEAEWFDYNRTFSTRLLAEVDGGIHDRTLLKFDLSASSSGRLNYDSVELPLPKDITNAHFIAISSFEGPMPTEEIPAALTSSSRPLSRALGLVLLTDTPKGRGVFASQLIPKGTIIDVSPVLIFSEEEVERHTSQTCLQHYTYYWPTSSGKYHTQALALGLGSMFNHSTLRQNVTWSRELESSCIIYTAYRDIQAEEELCISYGSARLRFEDADAARANDPDDVYSRIKERLDRTEHKADVQALAELEISGPDGINLGEENENT